MKQKDKEELLDIVDRSGRVLGSATREHCHSRSDILHRAVHGFVFTSREALFLQKRALAKSVQPGKWDSSVGGHVDSGETPAQAIIREAQEELGLGDAQWEPLYEYVWTCENETELVTTFRTTLPEERDIFWNKDEIMDGRFWLLKDLQSAGEKDPSLFTPNFLFEMKKYQDFCRGGELSPDKKGVRP